MSSKRKLQLLGPHLEMLPRLEGTCSSTISDCGAKNGTELASEEVDKTTVSMCDPSKPGNKDDFVKKQAFGDPKTGQRHLRNITNQIYLGPSPMQPKQSSNEHATNYELQSKKVDRLLEELSHELDKLLNLSSTTLDSDEFNLSSDEEDLDEIFKGKTSSVASREQILTTKQLKFKKADRFPKEVGEEVSMDFGLPKTTAKGNETKSSTDDYEPDNAKKEAHNRNPGKLSNNSFAGISEPSSTSAEVQSPQKLAETRCQSNCEAPSTSKAVLPSKKLAEAGLRNFSKPSSSLDVAQPLYKLPASRFKAVDTDTDETVSMSSDVKKKGEKEKEGEEEEKKEEDKDENELEFEKPPNWLDPLLLRAVPEIKETNPMEPCPPDTFFGKLHRNSPFAYTGHEKEPLDKNKKNSPAARKGELLQAAEQEMKKPLAEEKAKDSPPLDQISCSSKEREHKALEETLEKQKTKNSRVLEDQCNTEETLERELEKGKEMKEVKASEKKAQGENDSHGEDASEMKEVNVEVLKDSPSTLEVPHNQAYPPVVKTISAKEKDTLQAYSKDSLPLHSQDAPSSHVKDSISSASKSTPASPNNNSPLSHSKSSPLYSQDSLPSKIHFSILSNSKDSLPSKSKDYPRLHSKDSRPSNSKEETTTHSTTTDYPISLSKDSPPSHSRTSPSHSTDYVPSNSRNSLPSHSKDAPSPSPNTDAPPSSHNTDSRPSPCKDFAPHKQSFLPIQEQEEIIEQYDPEFPSLVTPVSTKELNVCNLDMLSGMPTARANHMTKWLYSQSFLRTEYEQQAMEVLPEYSLIQYSDDEEEPEDQEEASVSEPAKSMGDALQGELQSLQLNEAIPECCLTDSVFLVDKPKSAISQVFKMPVIPLVESCPLKNYQKIRVSHVYTPFQFWFNLVNHTYDYTALLEMQLRMSNFYNDCSPEYLNALPRCLIKAGYICAIRLDDGWRRARILASPPPLDDSAVVSIYYLDYGYGVDVPADDLRFLSQIFGETPELAVRGTLSHIHPLGPHWSPDSMEQFQRLIIGQELYAHIVELDLVERIVFLRISLNAEFLPSVNRMLVDANLAARSQHYDLQLIKNNFGRRPRYLRERLPSHEMLETRVFPVLNNEFEVAFDGIIYSPSFEKFTVPRLKKAYAALREALVAWMPPYRKEMKEWAVLLNAAKTKVSLAQCKAREAWLLREQKKRKEKEKRNRITQIMGMLKAHKAKEMGTAEEKEETLKATQEVDETLNTSQDDVETMTATDDEYANPPAGNMEEVD